MKLIKKSLNDTIIYGLGLALAHMSAYLMLPFYTRVFSPDEYAVITLVLLIIPFTRYFLSLEISQASVVFAVDEPQKRAEHISTALYFTILINIIVYVIFLSLNVYFEFFDIGFSHLLIICFMFFSDAIFYYGLNVLRWNLKRVAYNVINIISAILSVILTFIFVLYFKYSIEGVFIAWAISRFFGAFLCFYYSNSDYQFIFSYSSLKNALTFSVPLWLGNIPLRCNTTVDKLLILNFIGWSALGIYGAGFTISAIMNFIIISVASAITPLIYQNHENTNTPKETAFMFLSMLIACYFVTLVFSTFNKEILSIMLSDTFSENLMTIPLIPFLL